MASLLLSLCLMFFSGLGAWLVRRSPRYASLLGAGGVVTGCGLGLFPVLRALLWNPSLSLKLAWSIPFGSFYLHLDALAAFFLLPLFILSALSAIYGTGYMAGWPERRQIGTSWFFFNTLVVSMALVLLARNGILFLISWEVMSIASYFLVTLDDEKESACSAGWIYLIATHLGTAFLLALFVLLARRGGSFDFDAFVPALGKAPQAASLLFLLALIGFGTKAGFVPFHVWLAEAHPAAPSHVSALMSGIKITTGIYGLVRMLSLLGPTQGWWGGLLIGMGVCSGLLGIISALGQKEMKRLLAYSSVENVGIIALGLGMGLLGTVYGLPVVAVLGWSGALLHVMNHALFKGLLFLGAGSVLHSTETQTFDLLGGLLKRMPWTAATFLVGASAVSGLPVLNGFVSEFLIYMASLKGILALDHFTAAPFLAVFAALILIGGLTVACFAKAFGIVFLGEPRSDRAAQAHEAPWIMRGSQLILSLGCLAIALAVPFVLGRILSPVIEQASGLSPGLVESTLWDASGLLSRVVAITLGFAALVGLIAGARSWLLSRQPVETAATWGCGYDQPTARMQYTGTSFSQPLTSLFRLIIPAQQVATLPAGPFPTQASFSIQFFDFLLDRIYVPLFGTCRAVIFRLRWLQHGRLQIYILYIALTLLVLLLWKL
jgi:hydrogenase-4 component B